MTDNELLLAMSNVMDDKLKPVNDKLEKVEQKQEEMSGRLERVEQKQEEMSGRLEKVEQKQEEMSDRLEKVEQKQEEMSDRMNREFKRVDEQFECVNERLDKEFKLVNERLDKEFKVVNDRLKKMEITHENEILPRLQTIEECYVSTSKRYQEGADQIQDMQTNINIMEKIVADHSDQIQKLQAVNA